MNVQVSLLFALQSALLNSSNCDADGSVSLFQPTVSLPIIQEMALGDSVAQLANTQWENALRLTLCNRLPPSRELPLENMLLNIGTKLQWKNSRHSIQLSFKIREWQKHINKNCIYLLRYQILKSHTNFSCAENVALWYILKELK